MLSIIAADDEGHGRMRRNLSYAFSEKALRSQEPLLHRFIDLFIDRIGEYADQGKPIDIVRWLNNTAFDIISDLAFGAPLNCLADSRNDSTVKLIYGFVKAGAFLMTRSRVPFFFSKSTTQSPPYSPPPAWSPWPNVSTLPALPQRR